MCFFIYTLNTNISVQYGELAPQEKPNSSLEVVTFPWINVSGYTFYVMNTLHEFAASSKGKNCTFQITISGLPV